MSKYRPENQGMYSSQYEHDSCGIGFVANIKGKKSHDIIKRGLEVLERMEHRGAEGADNKTGDGSGIMLQLPHEFFKKQVKGLPDPGEYGAGLVFLPQNKSNYKSCINEFENIIKEEGLQLIGWRDIEVDTSVIGDIAKKSEPLIKQIFIGVEKKIKQDELERKLYIVRKSIEEKIRHSDIIDSEIFYIPTLSTRTIVYKGMLMPDQVRKYYKDLQNKELSSAIALVHSRFSTNTFPSWDLAQPFRMIAHNGEINTIKGNRSWMQSRESLFKSDLFGDDIKKILPVIEPGKSDSASFDNALEMLVQTGRSLPHTMMMLIPESFNEKNPIPEYLKDFYEFHSTFMEPWDGPASIVFCDGRFVGGTLDRNGLRPSRFVITKDDMIVMGSEIGVQNFPAEKIKSKGRLMPGKILLVDTQEGRIIPDEEIKYKISHIKPYGKWIRENKINLSDIEAKNTATPKISEEKLHEMQLMFGYNREDIDNILLPMINTAQEPTGSMGTDTPLAVFSDRPQRLFNYFKQIFAQVTNPAIDPIREELVMTLTSYIGEGKNLLEDIPDHCNLIRINCSILSNSDIEKLKNWENKKYKTSTFQMIFPVNEGADGLEKALTKLCEDVEEKIDEGYNFIILSDRGADKEFAPIPSLLACSSVHHHLIRKKKRAQVGLIIKTAEAREVMHFALLFGYGASAVNPYGAYGIIDNLVKNGLTKKDVHYLKAESNYIKAIEKVS